MISHSTRGSVTTLHDFGGVLGQPSDTFRLGSHNFMVTALGSCVKQGSGRFLGITGQDPSVCKSNRLHIDILWFSFTKLGYIL